MSRWSSGEVGVVKVASKGAIYLPRDVLEELGLEEGSRLAVVVEGGSIKLIPIEDPLDLALHGRKYARIKAEDMEKWSEEWQEKELGL